MREGENGTTAFYILSGTIEIFINNPVATWKPRAGRRAVSSAGSRRSPTTSKAFRRPRPRPGRAHPHPHGRPGRSADGQSHRRGGTPGDLIGELAALAALKQERLKRPKFYPRSATARAKTEVVVLEMLPNILNNVLYNAAAFKDKLNRNYRSRALESHLRSVPVFRNLSPEFLEYLQRPRGTGGRGARAR